MNIGEPLRIVEVPLPVAIPDTMPEKLPAAPAEPTPEHVPATPTPVAPTKEPVPA